jgi:hypothetical protein
MTHHEETIEGLRADEGHAPTRPTANPLMPA